MWNWPIELGNLKGLCQFLAQNQLHVVMRRVAVTLRVGTCQLDHTVTVLRNQVDVVKLTAL